MGKSLVQKMFNNARMSLCSYFLLRLSQCLCHCQIVLNVCVLSCLIRAVALFASMTHGAWGGGEGVSACPC